MCRAGCADGHEPPPPDSIAVAGWAEKKSCLSAGYGRQNVFDVDPLRGVLAGIAGDAVVIAFTAVAGIL